MNTKTYLISIATESDDGFVIYTTIQRAVSADEAKMIVEKRIDTEYAPRPGYSAKHEANILACVHVDNLFMDAICEGING